MTFDKGTANIINALLMFGSMVMSTLVTAGVINGKAGVVSVVCVQSAMQAFHWLMTAQGFDRLPNGEQLPLEAKTLPPGIQLQEPIAKRVEQEKP
jgi:hypothetical protein